MWEDGQLSIRFREPVVSRTVVQNNRRSKGSPAERGLELFTLSGSPAPQLTWRDQDELRVEFAPGTSVADNFRLDFKPGVTYLGGAPLSPASFSFRPRPVKLRVHMHGLHAGGAALLSAAGSDLREAQELAQRHEGLRVSFRRMRSLPFIGWVPMGSVPATLRPATVADGISGDADIGRALLEKETPGSIRPDTLLPQTLLAVPESPLVPGGHYRLELRATPESGLESFDSQRTMLPRELGVSLENGLAEPTGKAANRPRVLLRFDAPVAEDALRTLWRDMGVQLGGQAATLSEDGQSYRARVGGQEVALHLRRQLPLRYPCELDMNHRNYRLGVPYTAAGLEMELETDAPLDLALSLPPDFRAAHGLAPTQRELALRVLPAWPLWHGTGNLVPLSGSHLLRLPAVNIGSVTVSLHHWEADEAARLLPLISQARRDDSSHSELLYRLGWLRQERGLWPMSRPDLQRVLGYVEKALGLVREDRREQNELRRRVFAAGRAFPAVELTVEGQADAFVSRRDILLDLDAAAGGADKLRPGLYLVRLSSRPTESVRAELAPLGLGCPREAEGGSDDPLCCQVEYLVQVTDIALHADDRRGHLLAASLADGAPLDKLRVSLYELPERTGRLSLPAQPFGHAQEMTQGMLTLAPDAKDKLLLVQRGEDYRLCEAPDFSEGDAVTPERETLQLECFRDRPLYRPGEVAHLRCVLRDMSGDEPALPRDGRVEFSLSSPGGEPLETRMLTADAYGAVTVDVRLPEGEEDVTGRYCCCFRVGEVETELDLPCEVFRRDAFRLELETVADKVAPKELLLRVRATNYDGTPLRGGRVMLNLKASDGMFPLEAGEKVTVTLGELQPDGSLAGEKEVTVSADDDLGTGPSLAQTLRRDELRREFTLDDEGRAECRVTLAPLHIVPSVREYWVWVKASAVNGREEWVQALGSVTFSDADFHVEWDEAARRVRLLDARSNEPLAREQKLHLSVRPWESRWVALAPGVEMEVKPGTIVPGEPMRDVPPLLEQDITVPAGGRMDLGDILAPLAAEGRLLRLELSGSDCEGRTVALHRLLEISNVRHLPVHFYLERQGDTLCVTPAQDWGRRPLHAFISSQGRLRHTLAEPDPDGRLRLPLQASEYGSIELTLLRCIGGENGSDALWGDGSQHCSRPRPDKELAVELCLPQGAAPGETQRISGRVTDAAGRPQRAGVTLFAVDAGMLSVARHRLPELAHDFYQGQTPYLGFRWQSREALPRPALRPLGTAGWGLPSAWERRLWADFHPRGLSGIGYSAESTAEYYYRSVQPGLLGSPACFASYCDGLAARGSGLGATGMPPLRTRRDFAPVALWQGCVETAEDGSFSCPVSLPDTLTTYRVFAIALGADGSSFGQTEGEFLVNQPLMLEAGTPFFMSLGDRLQLPLTITNNSDQAGSWSVALEGEGEPQAAQLAAGESKTLYFDIEAREEGECTLTWSATNESSGDAVEVSFPVLYPAPLLKEHHHLVLEAGESLETAALLAPELAGSTRGSLTLEYATSPLLHLSGTFDYLLSYPYGCTEQRSSALLPWLYHAQLAPYCPQLGQTDAAEAQDVVARGIAALLARQQKDGGLSYWSSSPGEQHPSSRWATAFAGLVLTLAQEQGHDVPAEALERLRHYLDQQKWENESALICYAAARTQAETDEARRQLDRAIEEEQAEGRQARRSNLAALRFLADVSDNPAARHDALLRWLRSQGRDKRHRSTWSSGWELIALGEYLKHEAPAGTEAALLLDGRAHRATATSTRISLPAAGTLAEAMPNLRAQQGRVYVTVKAKAQPERRDYPGVTEKGLQVTRTYETKGADGLWHESSNWKVGDIVRVTLTCAKVVDEVEYLVLEDKLPACLEAINPRVPGQAVGLEHEGWGEWAPCIDHKEYLADRVRAFSTRWQGRELLNMSYYARVKRAGECIAPPAEAQLMYEPQTYGLSPNGRVRAAR